jgi:hypothetical protein
MTALSIAVATSVAWSQTVFEAPEPPAERPSTFTPFADRELPEESRLELHAEIGSTAYNDEHYDVFSRSDQLPVRGLRVGVRVHERVVAQAGWSHGARGATVYLNNDVSLDFEDDQGSLSTAYYADALSLGAKVDVPFLQRTIYPYLGVRGQMVHQRIRLDDDRDDPDSPGQSQSTAWAPGYEAVGGVEVRTPTIADTVRFAWTLELGRAGVAEATFEPLGTLRSGGLVFRTGVGARF